MNPFERHGIIHLSPSQISTFIAAPSYWLLTKLLGHKGSVGCAAHRGTATEAGVSAGLFDHALTADECVAVALPVYDRLSALSGDPKRDAERLVVPGMVGQGLDALRPKGNPIRPNNGDQHRIEIMIEGVSIPFVGFLDFEYADEIIDTKTTKAVPSKMSDTHLRQATIYKLARFEKRIRFTYLSDKKSNTITLTREDFDVSLKQIVGAAQRLERFLSLSDDPLELAAIIPHCTESFYFNDPATKAKALELFGY